MYYRFPSDEVLKIKWMKSCSVTKHLVSYRVCSKHFLPEDIKDNGRLMPVAVPSIHLGVNLHPNSENSSCKMYVNVICLYIHLPACVSL